LNVFHGKLVEHKAKVLLKSLKANLMLLDKLLSAVFTLERLFTRVDSFVFRQRLK
jgi:hypothetical protein